MISLDQFHFLRPTWLLVLLPLVIILWLMYKKKLGSRNWEAVCDDSLLPFILIGQVGKTRIISMVLVGLSGMIAIISLAGPVWEKLPQAVFTSQNALVIGLDLSQSMDANDITPDRLTRARYKIADILNARDEGQTALFVYAGEAFTVAPLTDDVETILSQLNALSTDIMPVAGNRTDQAIKMGRDLLRQAGYKKGDLLLITDEIDLERSQDAAVSLKNDGYRLSIIGVGTRHGVPVPLLDGSFLKDSKGKIVIPMLEEAPMQQLAQAGGGIYKKLSVDDSDIKTLATLLSATPGASGLASTELETDVWKEQGPWLALLLLPLTVIVFRRGYLVLVLLILLPLPDPAQAIDWQSLWLRSDQQAQRALQKGNNQDAAKLFKDPAWKGVAQYRSGDFSGAVKSLERSKDTIGLYNMGNSLARQGRYEEAIAAYKAVLQDQPGHEDARHNKELLEQEMEKQKQQNPDQQAGQDQDSENNQEGNRQDNNKESSGNNQDGNSRPDSQQDAAQQANTDQSESENEQQDQAEADQSEAENSEANNADEKVAREDNPGEKEQPLSAEDLTPDEEQQAVEQWLRRIPDDPGGLLRRKFRYQYQQRQAQGSREEKTW